jgi:hypothetical protein
MGYSNVALKDKIIEMYPEIEKQGISVCKRNINMGFTEITPGISIAGIKKGVIL